MPEPRVLYVIACAAGPAADLAAFVELAQAGGWTVCVAATPAGAEMVDQAALAERTGRPVRSTYRPSRDIDPWPHADAIVVAPATLNTICKWAAGIADNYALSTLAECMGVEVPIVAAPNVNPALARHPAFQASVGRLREWGVQVLYERSAAPPVWMASWGGILRTLDELGLAWRDATPS